MYRVLRLVHAMPGSPRIEQNNMCDNCLLTQQTQMNTTTIHQHAETDVHSILHSIVTRPGCIAAALVNNFHRQVPLVYGVT